MLQAPRGRPGAAFLWLAVAARTMAGGTCRERPGTSSRPTCDPPPPGARGAPGRRCSGGAWLGGPHAPAPGLGRCQVEGRRAKVPGNPLRSRLSCLLSQRPRSRSLNCVRCWPPARPGSSM